MTEEETTKEMTAEEQEDAELEQSGKLAFANAQVVRVMRASMPNDKMIRSEVKVAMNKFLEDLCAKLSKKMGNYPYAMIDYRMFKEAIDPYENMDRILEEKKRILSHLDAIKMDCSRLQSDVERTFIVEE